MQVTIDLPDEVAQKLTERSSDLPRQVLEAVALEGYRAGELTSAQVRRLLGLETRMELEAFLKRAGVELDYSEEDLARDLEMLRGIGAAVGGARW